MSKPLVTFIIATHNRCNVLIQTLQRLQHIDLPRSNYEIILVDNDSGDDTVNLAKPLTNLVIPLKHNLGSCAKALGVDRATAPFVIFLDDDSHPQPGSVARMLDYFEYDAALAAAGFSVHLPNGDMESSALPNVFHGCGVGLRTTALRKVGNLDSTFFMQTEEYDLCFKLANTGWITHVFDDLHVDHLKTAQTRRPERTNYLDTRNNLRLVSRFLTGESSRAYRRDWLQRYCWIAERESHLDAFHKGRAEGLRDARRERSTNTCRLNPDAFESFFSWQTVSDYMANLPHRGIQRIHFAGLGKNIYAFYRAATRLNLQILAIADDAFAVPGRQYRGIPVISTANAPALSPDAILICQTAPVLARKTADLWRGKSEVPLLNWFAAPTTSNSSATGKIVCDARSLETKPDLIPIGA